MDGNPKLRTVETHWVRHEGKPALLLRDRLGLSRQAVIVPQALLPLLALCDGTRDLRTLRSGFELRTGIPLSPSLVEQLVERLHEAMLLEGPRFEAAYQAAVEEYRRASFRPTTLAGTVYPADPEALPQQLDGFGKTARRSTRPNSPIQSVPAPSLSQKQDAPGPQGAATSPGPQPSPRPRGFLPGSAEQLRGIVCPHIDFARGGPTYAEAWLQAASAAREAELVVIFGTDHAGGPRLTLTRQSYATPWGALPTDLPVVDAVAQALGSEAFSHELHHRDEHSIEAAAVWLHYVRGGAPCRVVPILCGVGPNPLAPFPGREGGSSPEAGSGEQETGRASRGASPEPGSREHEAGSASAGTFLEGGSGKQEAEGTGGGTLAAGLEEGTFLEAMDALRRAAAGRRVLAVAAADLAHMGPVFGDAPLGPPERARLAVEDGELLKSVCQGDAEGLAAAVLADGDRRKVCGFPPIYALLRFLGDCRGQVTGYTQCPADAAGASFVSIAGVLLW